MDHRPTPGSDVVRSLTCFELVLLDWVCRTPLFVHIQSDHFPQLDVHLRLRILGPHIRGRLTVPGARIIQVFQSCHQVFQPVRRYRKDQLIISGERPAAVPATRYRHLASPAQKRRHSALNTGPSGIEGGRNHLPLFVFQAGQQPSQLG